MLSLPEEATRAWVSCDIGAKLAYHIPLHIQICKAAAAACGAELVFGGLHSLSDFLYIYIGVCVGGGLVLDNKVFYGTEGNAGDLSSFPIPADSGVRPLIENASLSNLDLRLHRAGKSSGEPCGSETWWSNMNDDILESWINDMAPGLAFAAIAVGAVCDIDTIVVDGHFPSSVRARIVQAVLKSVEGQYREYRNKQIDVVGGSLGPDAAVLGAASLFFLEFGQDERTTSHLKRGM